jgi:hypothetical protein
MELTLSTPALLFPATSLLLLVYANRFLSVAKLIRDLYASHKKDPSEDIRRQIEILRARAVLIRNMQAMGIASLFLCGLCMLVLFAGYEQFAKVVFIASLAFFLGSLGVSLREAHLSINALDLHISELMKDAES